MSAARRSRSSSGHSALQLEPRPGTYLLQFASSTSQEVQVGRLGRISLQPGDYLYVGSALGPGGLRARVQRHLQSSSNLHWHIDYVRPFLELKQVMFAYQQDRLEHSWALQLLEVDQARMVMAGFGSSDCHCPAHFFYSEAPMNQDQLLGKLRHASEGQSWIQQLKIDGAGT